MSEWNYKRDESGNNGFTTGIPEGKHRVRIKSAEKAVSKTGNDMLSLQFDVSGYPEIVYHYIVFLKDNVQLTNQKLTQFFDSFKDIPDGEFDMSKWIGKVGACTIKHEEYNDNINAKVGYFIHADKQGDLPAWVEPPKKADDKIAAIKANTGDDEFMNIPEGLESEIPFA